MAFYWRRCLAISGLALLVLAACGPEEPSGEEPQMDGECLENDDCSEDAPLCNTDPTNLQDVDDPVCVECFTDDQCDDEDAPFCYQGECHDDNFCETEHDCHGDTPYCGDDTFCTDIPPEFCQDNDDCTEPNAPYCNMGACVSRDYICDAQDCAGRRGVCNPDAGVDGDCINAETCTHNDQCTTAYMCIDEDGDGVGECLPRGEVCDCSGAEECFHDSQTLSSYCEIDQVCEPETSWCEGDVHHFCIPDGTAEQTNNCTEGCVEDDDDTARCIGQEGDTCGDAFRPADDGEPRHLSFQWNEFSNTYTVDSSSGCFPSDDDNRTSGGDVTFQLELEPGEVGLVEKTLVWDFATMYVFDECPSAGAYSCVEPHGEIIQSSDGEYYRAIWMENDTSQTQTYYVVADSGVAAGHYGVDFTFVVSEQICEPEDDVCSEGELGTCSQFGTHFETDPTRECTLGCETDDPTDALCEPMAHSQCSDATYYDGESLQNYSGEIIDFHSDVTLNSGDCIDRSIGSSQNSSFQGPSAYYEVDLDEGERLNANLYSEFEAGVWFATSCGTQNCQRVVNQSDHSEAASYTASEAETVYVAVQAVDADVPRGSFTLDLSIDPPECQGEEAGHILGCDGDHLRYCDGTDFPRRYACEGGCDNGECGTPTGDTCLDYIELQPGDQYSGTFSDMSDELTPLYCSDGGDSFDDPVGPDQIFQINIDSGHLVNVDLNTISADAGFYLLDDCPVATKNASNQCVYGSIPDTSAEFFVSDGGDHYLVVDSANRFDPADFTLTVDTIDAVCMPDSYRCFDGDVEQCHSDGTGFELNTQCAIGCDDDEFVCAGPDVANDSCGANDTYYLEDSGQIVDQFDRFSNQESLDADQGGCFDDDADGPDVFYEFELGALEGVTIDATIDIAGLGSNQVGMYIAEGCVSDGADCEEVIELSGAGTLEDTLGYLSQDGGTYTFGLVGLSSFDDGTFTLDVDFFDADCDPALGDQCDGDTAIECTDLGHSIETTCSYGCSDGQCLDQKGDACSRPYVLEDDGDVTDDDISLSIDGNIGDFSNAFDPYSDGESCIDDAEGLGPDVVVQLDAYADDEVTVDLDTNYDGALWITSDCADAAGNCIAGSYETFGPGDETLTYTFDQQGTYYVIADSTMLGSTGHFDLDVVLDKGPRLTDPAIEVDGADDLSWELEASESATDQITISNNGELDLTFDVVENHDWLDVSPEDGTVAEGDSLDLDVTADCGGDDDNYQTAFTIESNDPTAPETDIIVQLTCYELASVDVTVDGLPDGTDHDIDFVDNDNDESQPLPADGSLSGLVPGSYTLEVNDVTVGDNTYTGDDVDVVLDSGDNAEPTVDYSPVDGTLEVTVDGLDSVDDATYDIEVLDDEDILVATLDQDNLTVDLAPGDYTLVADDVEDDDVTYTADDVDAVITSDSTESVTVSFQEEDDGDGT